MSIYHLDENISPNPIYMKPASSPKSFIARTLALVFPPTEDFLRLRATPPPSEELIPLVCVLGLDEEDDEGLLYLEDFLTALLEKMSSFWRLAL